MDIVNQSRADMKMTANRISSVSPTNSEYVSTTKNNIKRSFDVAFLMMPDERLKNKPVDKNASTDAVVSYPSQIISVKSDESLREIINEQRQIEQFNSHQHHKISQQFESSNNNNNNESAKSPRYSIQGARLPRIYDDPTIYAHAIQNGRDPETPRSAFTKVPHIRQESPLPPPLSPDQMSCPSTSPPVSASPPRNLIYRTFRPDYHQFVNTGPLHTISQMHQAAQAQAHNNKYKQQFMYRPSQNYRNNDMESTVFSQPAGAFPFSVNAHPFVQQPDITGMVRNPAAAALLTTLIPPTIATSFTLTAQNVCAKCNISFRMTSDLVYHMRSHHKSEFTNDTNRRKREEKLKCPVCNESFRERHHLTRHMTAHQDKESDESEINQIPNSKRFK